MYLLENADKAYTSRRGTVHALRNVSLEIPTGSCVTITGPSGSGKTTLLLTLGGLIRPTSGRVLFRGVDLGGLSDAELARYRNQKIGFVLQTFNLVPYLSALENVMVPTMFLSGSSDGSAERARGLLGRLGLGDRADHLPRELSVGEQQRVAIARALGNNPEVILADEPTGNLDPHLSAEVLGILRELNEKDGRTVIMVTHSPEAARIGKRRLHLFDGTCRAGAAEDSVRSRGGSWEATLPACGPRKDAHA
jgi:putative ABC transport system ATP-binding protein